ncbi:hypothetical protein BDY17DRAFT_321728 [Neohortaea acidophila]|uniref:Uncharacterized protein n=1 Tax=Neohortaea acidophila TaxID=245834 RepID=A0A6A6PYL6_9PEZI|nr:uncharacterized protein BDY17DRAFT_321728 [Neohortaea acidophila]KAF2484829.1 hypothetical protein BDY17DRAFT_321728 [Neohortaea acidophila]
MALLRMPSPPETMADATEAEFLSRLQLNLDLEHDRRRYHAMKADIFQGCQRICYDRSCLLPYLRNDASIRPPFICTQITEGALHAEARRIYRTSHPDIQRIYDLGGDEGSASRGAGGDGSNREQENWVIRWLLWRTLLAGADGDGESAALAARSKNAAGGGVDGSIAGRAKQTYWDPARESWSPDRERNQSAATAGAAEAADSSSK